MDHLDFDISGILSEEEAEKLFEETDADTPEDVQENGNENEDPRDAEEEEEETQPSEEVGDDEEDEDEKEEDTAKAKSRGSSPTVLSSIASALKKDGIFPDFDDEELANVKTAEDFAELVEKAITAKMDERSRRISEALSNGVAPSAVKQYEQTLGYLNSIDEDALFAEDEKGVELRKQLIFNDLMKKGYTRERAIREIEKSFKSQTDLDDAKDALEALRDAYEKEYNALQTDAKNKAEASKKQQKEQAESFKKMILDDEIKVGRTSLDKNTRKKVYEAVTAAVYEDKETGKYLTAVQKFQKEQPLEFLKQLGLWYVLTNEGKNLSGILKKEVQNEKNKGIRELERKLKGNSFDLGGGLRYDGDGSSEGDDLLLSDDWQIGK